MKVAIFAKDDQWKEMKTGDSTINFVRLNSLKNISPTIEACIVLDDSVPFDFKITSGPILINEVVTTLREMNTPPNIVRINGWNTFIGRTTWEVAGKINQPVHQLFSFLKKQFIPVPDEPGFVSARIIAMIINEAYFALEERVSTKEEINTAMKLGTNYPYGPFEWASLIGVHNIYSLLQKLSISDRRYLPAPFLQQEATTWL